MPNYHLVQSIKKENIEIEFTKIKNFEKLNKYKLEDIIKFTSYFIDETHLKETLLSYNLIKDENYNKKLKIIYPCNKKIKTLMYGITYQNDLTFFEEDYIRDYLKSKINDIQFLEKLCNHYRNSYNQSVNLAPIRNYIAYIKTNQLNEIDMVQSDIRFYLDNFVSYEIYTKINDKYKISYKKLRDLAMFLAYDYNKQDALPKINKDILYGEPKVNEKKQLSKQLTFKDMGWL